MVTQPAIDKSTKYSEFEHMQMSEIMSSAHNYKFFEKLSGYCKPDNTCDNFRRAPILSSKLGILHTACLFADISVKN